MPLTFPPVRRDRLIEIVKTRSVETGRTSGQWTQIRSGLNTGERYAATNSYLVKAELSKGEAEEE